MNRCRNESFLARFRAEDLQCHHAIEPDVRRPVHDRHAAATDQLLDPVAATRAPGRNVADRWRKVSAQSLPPYYLPPNYLPGSPSGLPLTNYRANGSRQRFVIGSRRSRPGFFAEIFGPGGYCLRLYSDRSTSPITRWTSSGS